MTAPFGFLPLKWRAKAKPDFNRKIGDADAVYCPRVTLVVPHNPRKFPVVSLQEGARAGVAGGAVGDAAMPTGASVRAVHPRTAVDGRRTDIAFAATGLGASGLAAAGFASDRDLDAGAIPVTGNGSSRASASSPGFTSP